MNEPSRWVRRAMLAGALAGSACASSPPPELQDARSVYARVARGEAKSYAPAALKEANHALAAAEEAYQRGAEPYLVRDRAYVAIRSAELAQVRAATERTREELANAPGAANDVRDRISAAEKRLDTQGAPPAPSEGAKAEPEEALPVASSPVAVEDEARGTVISVPPDVLFLSDRTDFLPGAEARLLPVAEVLGKETNRKVVVEGTSPEDTKAADVGLSMRRADKVREFLVAHQVPGDRVSVTEPGEAAPVNGEAASAEEPIVRSTEIIVSLNTPAATEKKSGSVADLVHRPRRVVRERQQAVRIDTN